MRGMPTVLLAAVVSWLVQSATASVLPEGWDAGTEFLLRAEGEGHWSVDRLVFDSTEIDASIRFTVNSEYANLLAVPAFSSDPDLHPALRRARALLRWPGTPWIGAGVYLGEGQPFIQGLYQPLIEHGWISPDSIKGFSFSSGGFLGFNGEFSMARSGTDTLSMTRIRSPWLGFAGLSYTRTALHVPEDSIEGMVLNSLMIWGDLRYVEPWIVISGSEGEPGNWAVEGEFREFSPFSTDWGKVELVPGFRVSGTEFQSPGPAFTRDQRTLYLSAILKSDRYFAGADLSAFYDFRSDSLSGAALRGGMISSSGISCNTEFMVTLEGELMIAGRLGTTSDASSVSLGIRHEGDSTRVTGIAAHSPRGDVTGELTVSGNTHGRVNPLCSLDLSTMLGPASGHLALIWDDGRVSLSAELRGYFK